MDTQLNSEPDVFSQKKISWKVYIFASTVLSFATVVITLWAFMPVDLDTEKSIHIVPGTTVSEGVAAVAAADIVRSETVLYLVIQLLYGDETLKTGTYTFSDSVTVFAVAEKLMLTTPADELRAITFPEGITAREFARIGAETLENVAEEEFLALAATVEGQLWPETYFVPITYTTVELFELVRANHDETLESLRSQIEASGLTQEEVVILASILEREANDETSMRTVAGILRNRLEQGMLLQADATIEYILETPLNELAPGELAQNLREVESPYNTYKNTGLPPTAIGNPGRQALEAVVNPIDTDYLFYITGNDGVFYYAETYNGHLVNIERYLR